MMLWALHIADGILEPVWLVGGFLLAGALAFLGTIRLREEKIPQIALLTAAFFVVSLIHIRIGPTSAHLLLNGLLGVILGRHVALAIPIGLCLQAILIAHGGFSTLGVNSCVMVIPALLVGALFRQLSRFSRTERPLFRSGLVGLTSALWLLCSVLSVSLLISNPLKSQGPLRLESALEVTFHPGTLGLIAIVTIWALWAERRWMGSSELPLGLLLGVVSVLLSVVLNALVLFFGGVASWNALVIAVLIVHLPIAVVEGVILGFTVSFLSGVKPELLGMASRCSSTKPLPSLSAPGESPCGATSVSS